MPTLDVLVDHAHEPLIKATMDSLPATPVAEPATIDLDILDFPRDQWLASLPWTDLSRLAIHHRQQLGLPDAIIVAQLDQLLQQHYAPELGQTAAHQVAQLIVLVAS